MTVRVLVFDSSKRKISRERWDHLERIAESEAVAMMISFPIPNGLDFEEWFESNNPNMGRIYIVIENESGFPESLIADIVKSPFFYHNGHKVLRAIYKYGEFDHYEEVTRDNLLR
jgi:hypothetical protein